MAEAPIPCNRFHVDESHARQAVELIARAAVASADLTRAAAHLAALQAQAVTLARQLAVQL